MSVAPEIEHGETEVEDDLDEAFARLVREGDERLHRPLLDQVVTGLRLIRSRELVRKERAR